MNENINSDNSFSILMANYNNGKYIEESIKSVLSQTYSNWELVIVDDCSDDNSIEKIRLFLKDNRIKLIRHKKNYGVGFTKRDAASNASNKILGILDPDDKLHESALEIMNNAYNENPDCGFIYSTMWRCNSELKNCKIVKKICSIPEKTFIFNPYISQFRTFLKDAYNKTSGFDIYLKKAVDKDILYKLEEVTKFKFINMPLYYYREHDLGISQGKNNYKAKICNYKARIKTYKRRLNSNLPNFSKKDLYIEFYYITFYKLIKFVVLLFILLNISTIIKSLFKIFPNIALKNKIIRFKERYIDLF